MHVYCEHACMLCICACMLCICVFDVVCSLECMCGYTKAVYMYISARAVDVYACVLYMCVRGVDVSFECARSVLSVYVCMYVFMYVCMYVCIYVIYMYVCI